jgi:hypothetical protein
METANANGGNDWKKSATRQLLHDDLVAGLHEGKTLKEFYQSRGEYRAIDYVLWTSRFYSMKKTVAKGGGNNNTNNNNNNGVIQTSKRAATVKEVHWLKDSRRQTMEADLMDGIDEVMTPREYYEMHPEFQSITYELWLTRYNSLKKIVNNLKLKAAKFKLKVEHDRKIFPAPATNYRNEPRWDGSSAQTLLKADVTNGKHKTMAPRDLWKTQEAYQRYPLDVFRNHIYQEKRYQRFVKGMNKMQISKKANK